jgi:hypothetical protein
MKLFIDDWRYPWQRTVIRHKASSLKYQDSQRDIERSGALHEYYQPDNGEPILNRGFQNWNYLVLNMIAWLEGKPCIQEF